MNDIKFLLSNLYILHNEKLFRQVIGIPIGSDCSQYLANLFLFSYEHEHVDALMESGHEDADLLGHSHRYIDDLLVLNDMGYIVRMYQKFIPQSWYLIKPILMTPWPTTWISRFHVREIDLLRSYLIKEMILASK